MTRGERWALRDKATFGIERTAPSLNGPCAPRLAADDNPLNLLMPSSQDVTLGDLRSHGSIEAVSQNYPRGER